jgi:hypothetical protein
MLDQAWERLEDLPFDERTNLEVVALRLRIATARQRWPMAETLAEVLSEFIEEGWGKTVARYHLARQASDRKLPNRE